LNPKEDASLKELIRKSALLNAVKHDGNAQIGPVVGKILGERPEYRDKVKELSALINEVVMVFLLMSKSALLSRSGPRHS
jgi:glutamyl-tRNA synthetase